MTAERGHHAPILKLQCFNFKLGSTFKLFEESFPMGWGSLECSL